MAEVFPRHIQIHYGQYQREQLFEALRRSRSCAYLADDDHGPLALAGSISLAGCPTVGVRTGASFVRTRVKREYSWTACHRDGSAWTRTRTSGPGELSLAAIELAQAMDRADVCWRRAAEEYDTEYPTADRMIGALGTMQESMVDK